MDQENRETAGSEPEEVTGEDFVELEGELDADIISADEADVVGEVTIDEAEIVDEEPLDDTEVDDADVIDVEVTEEVLTDDSDAVDGEPAGNVDAPDQATVSSDPLLDEVLVDEALADDQTVIIDDTVDDTTVDTVDARADEADLVSEVSEEEIVVEEAAPLNRIDDLTDDTSVIDAGFAAPAVPEPVEELAEEIELEIASDSPVVEEVEVDVQPTEEPGGDTVTEEVAEVLQTDDPETTGVMRRSLFESPSPESDETVVSEVIEETAISAPDPFVAEDSAPAAGSPGSRDAAILEGATILPEVPSRQPSRWLSALSYLFLVPLAWYLLSDAGGRFLIANESAWTTGQVNLAALGEFAGGIALVVLLGIIAAQSSLGMYIAGIILTVIGIPFLVIPALTAEFLFEYVAPPLSRLGAFGNNVSFYLEFAGATGILLFAGIAMIVTGWAITSVRRKGRAEEALRVEVAEVNPDGLRARWARKATERAGR